MTRVMSLFMAWTLLFSSVPATYVQDGGLENEVGNTLTLKEFSAMADLNLFGIHLRAGIDAKATRDAVVKMAKLTGKAAKEVYNVSKDVVVFTGEQALEMVRVAKRVGIKATEIMYDGAKAVVIATGELAKVMYDASMEALNDILDGVVKIEDSEWYLIPTSEVPLTNYGR